MDVSEFVIHQIRKEAGSSAVPHFGRGLLPVDERVSDFMVLAANAFESKSQRITASFHPDTKQYPFSDLCRSYFSGDTGLYELSLAATGRLAERMEGTPATGGFVIFAGYTIADSRFLMILMLHTENGFAVDEKTLSLHASPHLALAQIDKAATIEGGAAGNGAMPEKPLAFAGFRKALSQYFQEFLGPDKIRDAKRESRELKKAIDRFVEKEEVPLARRQEIKETVQQHLMEQAVNQEEVLLDTIAAIVNPDEPEAFAQFANEKMELESKMEPAPQVFKRWGRIRYSSPDGLQIQVPEELLLDKERIVYDPAAQTLTFLNVPEKLAKQLDAALRTRPEDGE